jgi:hypothetical protein
MTKEALSFVVGFVTCLNLSRQPLADLGTADASEKVFCLPRIAEFADVKKISDR